MNPEHKALWLADLRSGKFPQTKGALRRIEPHLIKFDRQPGFCCLGVACETAIANGISLEVREAVDGVVKYNREVSYLPSAVADWLETSVSPHFDLDVKYRDAILSDGSGNVWKFNLTDLNDDGFTFDQIADIVEYFF